MTLAYLHPPKHARMSSLRLLERVHAGLPSEPDVDLTEPSVLSDETRRAGWGSYCSFFGKFGETRPWLPPALP